MKKMMLSHLKRAGKTNKQKKTKNVGPKLQQKLQPTVLLFCSKTTIWHHSKTYILLKALSSIAVKKYFFKKMPQRKCEFNSLHFLEFCPKLVMIKNI